MIAIDTNLLVYASVKELSRHAQAADWFDRVCHERQSLAVPWPVVHEFLATTTRAKLLANPLSMSVALEQIGTFIQRDHVQLLAESANHFDILARLSTESRITGPRIHDARIAAICIGHGVDTIWTADRDFAQFSGLSAVDPLN